MRTSGPRTTPPPGAAAHPRRPLRPVSTSSTLSGTSRLQDPARLGSSASTTVPVSDPGGPGSLDAYMALPPQQYSALDPGLIQPLGGNRFQLRVPRITIFSQWLEPTVDIVVVPAGGPGMGPSDRVVLRSAGCRLRGSELVERMRLDERIELRFETELTWSSASGSESYDSSSGSGGAARISGDLQLEVLTEVISPFHLLPRTTLEGAGNAVLRGLVASLFPMFLKRLAADYQRWAVDEEYRRSRAS